MKWEREHNYKPEETFTQAGFKVKAIVTGNGVVKLRLFSRTRDLVPSEIDFELVEVHALKKYLEEFTDFMMFEEADA